MYHTLSPSSRASLMSVGSAGIVDRALVLSIDEKSQIQALDREQPALEIKKIVPWQDFRAGIEAVTETSPSSARATPDASPMTRF